MSIDPKREELKKLIEERAWMINDARVFTWAKSGGRRKELENLGLGGGNFLVTLGLFSVLNFLSKTYYLIQNDAELWTKEEINKINKALKKCPDIKGAVPPFIGSPKISEKECFVRFALDLEFPLFEGRRSLSREEEKNRYGDVWNYYRDKLSHMAKPKYATVAIDFEHTPYEGVDGVESLLNSNTDPAFVKKDGNYAVYPDLFARDIGKWIGWLKLRIEDQRIVSDTRIEETIKWIKTN